MRKITAVLLGAVPLAGAGTFLLLGPAAGAPGDRPQRPAPYVQPWAHRLPPAKPKIDKRPKQKPVPANVDGCDHAYGVSGQCVPWDLPRLPAGQTVCGFLKELGLDRVKVHGRDRHRLDRDRDGIACDG